VRSGNGGIAQDPRLRSGRFRIWTPWSAWPWHAAGLTILARVPLRGHRGCLAHAASASLAPTRAAAMWRPAKASLNDFCSATIFPPPTTPSHHAAGWRKAIDIFRAPIVVKAWAGSRQRRHHLPSRKTRIEAAIACSAGNSSAKPRTDILARVPGGGRKSASSVSPTASCVPLAPSQDHNACGGGDTGPTPAHGRLFHRYAA